MKKIYLLIAIVLLGVSACKPSEDITGVPSYVHIQKADVHIPGNNFLVQGDSFQNITDIWLSVSGSALGAYELPATIPALFDGNQNLGIQAGIKENGTGATRAIYPFYTYIIKNVNLQSTKTLDVHPIFQYDPKTKFIFNERFENSNPTIQPFVGNNTAKISYPKFTDPNYALYGENRCMEAQLINSDSGTFYASDLKSRTGFTIGNPVWMEISFNTEVPLTVGMFVVQAGTGSSYSSDLVTLNTTGGLWKKVYINFTDLIYNEAAGSGYSFYIEGFKAAGNQIDHIYIDNIKLLCFE